jgi:hypothetical protein
MCATPIELTTGQAEFGAPVVRDVLCGECLDTGTTGSTAWTPGGRCEACRGPSLVTRALRHTPLGAILAAPPRTLVIH